MSVVAGNPGCYFANPVVPVPTYIQSEEKIFDRIENRNPVGVQITDHIPVPKAESFQPCVHGDTVSNTATQGTEVETKRIPFPIFRYCRHRIVTEFVSALHKFFRSQL